MEGNAEEIQKQIEQRINELPPDIQRAVLSSDYNEKIRTIGEAFGLHIDQIQELSDFTMLMMLGFMKEEDYRKELMTVFNGNSSLTEKVLRDVNQQIFLSIRESMKGFSAGQGGGAAAPAPVPAAPAPTSAPARAPLSEVLPKKDVVMPATSVAPVPAAPSSPMKSSPAASTPSTSSSAPLPAIAADMHPADVMLTEKTVATPATPAPAPVAQKPADTKATPPKPTDYKADPYREPIN